jgi:hypothetical protein
MRRTMRAGEAGAGGKNGGLTRHVCMVAICYKYAKRPNSREGAFATTVSTKTDCGRGNRNSAGLRVLRLFTAMDSSQVGAVFRHLLHTANHQSRQPSEALSRVEKPRRCPNGPAAQQHNRFPARYGESGRSAQRKPA